MTVGEEIAACEYINCEVVDALGNPIEITEDNKDEMYNSNVEHISANNSTVVIWTFINMEKLGCD
jgi:hypothetical protein